MILNALLLLVAVIPFALIYLTKRYKWKIDGKYLDILAILVMTFLGAFLAIRLTIYQNEKDQKSALAAMLESAQWVCQSETRITQLVLDSLDVKPESYFDSMRFIQTPSDPTILSEILRNGDLYRHTSHRFRSLLPHLISSFSSLGVEIKKDKRASLEFLLGLLSYESDVLEAEKEFVTGTIGEDEAAQKHRSSIDRFMGSLQKSRDSLQRIRDSAQRSLDSLNNEKKALDDSLKVLESLKKRHR